MSTSTRERRIYGQRARLGLLVPSTNTTAETEFWRMAPAGVTVHTSRMPFFAEQGEHPFEDMEQQVPRVLDEACTADPDVIVYACTASSAKPDPGAYEHKIADAAGRATVTAAASLVAALERFGARRIALLTPYPQAINDKERRFFAGLGIEVIEDESIIVDPEQLKIRNLFLVPTDTLVERAIALGRDARVEAVVLSCCDMPTLDAIPRIEAAIDKPVTSSNQSLFWRALRGAGISEPLTDYGRLLAQH
jgi:arylmalonate decarboxylase